MNDTIAVHDVEFEQHEKKSRSFQSSWASLQVQSTVHCLMARADGKSDSFNTMAQEQYWPYYWQTMSGIVKSFRVV